jgi:large subunit ribosomal protein L31
LANLALPEPGVKLFIVARLNPGASAGYISQLPLNTQLEYSVKADIHPVYATTTVHCACGNTFQTRSVRDEIHLDICSNCHPFYTGKQKLIDTAGRVERFNQKFKRKAAV